MERLRRSPIGGVAAALAITILTGPAVVGQSTAPVIRSPAPRSMAPSLSRTVVSWRIRCWGSGEPTIVLVGGHPSAGIADFEGQPFLRPLAQRTRTCAYARSGYSGSDPAPNEPRDADDVIGDLDELLASAGVDGPVVLVGESFGGFIVSYDAAKHPEDVVGVVLLEVPAPDGGLTLEDIPEIGLGPPGQPRAHRYARRVRASLRPRAVAHPGTADSRDRDRRRVGCPGPGDLALDQPPGDAGRTGGRSHDLRIQSRRGGDRDPEAGRRGQLERQTSG